MSDPKGYYARLGVAPTASVDEIKQKYRKLAQYLHPDRPDGGNAEAMSEVNEASNVLSDPTKRAAYDALTNSYAANMLRGFFDQYLKDGDDTQDPTRIIRDAIARGMAETQMQIIELRSKLRSYEKRQKRLRYKQVNSNNNLFKAIVERRIKEAQEEIRQKEHFLQAAEQCRALVDDYEFTL
jgi:curved DNA-binding protein CbpA